MAYLEQVKIQDGATLYSGTISAIGPTTIIDTQYYGSVAIQISGPLGTSIVAQTQGSNDQSDWNALLLNSTGDITVTDTINSVDDTFILKTSHRYIRLNVAQFTGAPLVTIIGRSGTGPNAADNLTAAFNRDTPLQVAFGNGVKQDAFGALILSDGIPFYLNGNNNTYVINLNGYSSIYLHLSGSQTVSATQSIDGTLWSACYFGIHNNNSQTTTPNSAGIWIAPVLGQYLKLVVTGAVATTMTAAVVLKNTPMNAGYYNSGIAPLNLQLISSATNNTATAQLGMTIVNYGGTAVVNGGVAGLTGVGGNIGVGVAPTANPVPVGGIDPSGLTRRTLQDANGRTQVISAAYPGSTHTYPTTTNILGSNNSFMLGISSQAQSMQNIPTLGIQDHSQYEGQLQIELLAQILLEMKIMNQQLYELPKIQNLGMLNPPDTPEQLRSDPSIFNNINNLI